MVPVHGMPRRSAASTLLVPAHPARYAARAASSPACGPCPRRRPKSKTGRPFAANTTRRGFAGHERRGNRATPTKRSQSTELGARAPPRGSTVLPGTRPFLREPPTRRLRSATSRGARRTRDRPRRIAANPQGFDLFRREPQPQQVADRLFETGPDQVSATLRQSAHEHLERRARGRQSVRFVTGHHRQLIEVGQSSKSRRIRPERNRRFRSHGAEFPLVRARRSQS